MKVFVLLAGFWLLMFPAHALQTCEAAPEKFHVLFANGILTTVKEGQRSQDKLAETLGPMYGDQDITYDLAYNYTAGLFEDIIQSADQYLTQYTSKVMLWFYQEGDVPKWFNDAVQKLPQVIDQVIAPELSAHVAKYREAILQGQKVLVVPHSQGNFYVNEAKKILETAQPSVPMTSFGIFGVATPANNVGGANAPYLTNHRDFIRHIPEALKDNWKLHRTEDNSLADDLGEIKAHYFLDTYLSEDFDIRPALVDRIRQKLGTLQDPPEIVGSGPITVTMTWNLGNSDIDLHLFEPDQSHVYYENLQGVSGFLDLDNRDGFGPEHYYTDCNQLQVGKYVVGLNYYQDHDDDDGQLPARPVTTTVTITVPNATRTFTRTLNDDIQDDGNDQPMKVADIIVEQIIAPNNPNLNNKLKYQIIESQ